ncbi:MAG: hypothetical protein JXB47_05855 [Anaerolineae bacterium]|nr:hypothetical protein [Anaerolineae bacterium]
MDDLITLLETYGPPALVYLICRAVGLSRKESVGYAGFTEWTGRSRERAACWPGALAAMRARLREADPLLLPLLPETLRAYRTALEQDDRTVARDVLDRLFGKPGTRKTDAEAGDGDGASLPLIVYERVAGDAHDD